MNEASDKPSSNEGALSRLRPWVPILVACALLSAYSAKSGSPAPLIELSWRDKVDHFCVYGLLATLVFQALPSHLQGTRRWLCAFALTSAFGIWDETLQHFNPARTGDPLDWFADSLGALAAVVLCSAFPCVQKLAAWSCFSLRQKEKRPVGKNPLQAR